MLTHTVFLFLSIKTVPQAVHIYLLWIGFRYWTHAHLFKGSKCPLSTWWLILSTLSVVIYIATFITNFVYTASNFKIMGISMLLGLIPNLFLSIKGIFLVVPSTQFTEPLVRYSMLTILNLIWWDHYSKPLSHCSPCCDVHFITLLRSSENSTTRIDS